MKTLTEKTPAFDEQNLFLNAVLGVASCLRHFDEILERFGHPTVGQTCVSEADIRRDELLCAVLGLASLRNTLTRELEEASRSAATTHGPDAKRRRLSLR